MALDLTGIDNRNEFYATHYLAAVLEHDLKEVVERWTKAGAEGERDPGARLLGMIGAHGRLRAQLAGERDMATRLELQRGFFHGLLGILGYEMRPDVFVGAAGRALPVLGSVARASGRAELILLEVPPPGSEDETALGPLQATLVPEQFADGEVEPLLGVTVEDAVTRHVFSLPEPPRWVVVVAAEAILVIERGKWPAQRLLAFDLPQIFADRDLKRVRYTAILLHREHLAPASGLALLDTLDESSHRHAFGVSQDLKYALREAIELIGNEALWYLREKRKEKVYDGAVRPADLSLECLRYMYRLLFLFYVEARRELGYAPINDPTYASGYALEALREYELAAMDDAETADGHFLDLSLKKLFALVWEGFSAGYRGESGTLAFEGENLFALASLRASLFDPVLTPILGRVHLRNHVLRRVLELMSLSRPGARGRGRDRRRGRISYAQLGINQLGAVYEALLSYRGFFAEEDLYEVKPAGDDPDDLEAAWFVGRGALIDYRSDEIVMVDGRPRCHPKGSFVYRLAGRARESSASYYTPES